VRSKKIISFVTAQTVSRVLRSFACHGPAHSSAARPPKSNRDSGFYPYRRDDKIKVTAQDVAAQRQAMKKPGATKAPAGTAVEAQAAKPVGNGRRKPGRKPAAVAQAAPPRPIAAGSGSAVDLIDKTFAQAQECGGMAELKRLVDRLAER
jgi:hypothetical protein